MAQWQSTPVDKFGIDPLLVTLFDEIESANTVNIRIDASLAGNPQMVSHKQFGTNAYWRHILIANGLFHPSEMVAGMLIRIPIQRPKQPVRKVSRTTI
ncbi:tail sheath [Dickeya phage vB_DsoM_JA29]|uniref:Uncharacterized protein n=1 Tax=Dickeya phage vB_DsoM_JA29 TaxID=2283031 RepID=A0A384ZX83_9CAUD|nr:tail sheath [Dickeya phage vB_DsoM_JA29]AXG66844.1 hypothetical protein JA29_118 [Dickeya phage vB_DsoM_JA29]